MDKHIELYQELEKQFITTKLSIWESSESEFMNAKPLKKLSSIFPNWFDLVEKGMKVDREEAIRTLRHTLHTLKVYFSIMNDIFETNVNKTNIEEFKKELLRFYEYHPLYFFLILLYHDIGRPFNRTWHTLKSEELIKKFNLLKQYSLSNEIEKLILTIIKHHLLVGTIFTGESSYYGSITLYSDIKKMDNNLSDYQIQMLFDTLKIFTLIDILGYDYGKIYDHYFLYYNNIAANLINIFQNGITFRNGKEHKEFLKSSLFRLDSMNLKWRIACSLRIFQFITVKPSLTKEFYYSKIEKGLANFGTTWNKFENNLGKNHSRLQFKYALPLMMILSTKKFRREPIDASFHIQPEIFSFWENCAKIVDRKIYNLPNSIYNSFYIVFDFPRYWFFKSDIREKIKNNIIKALKNSSFSFDPNTSDYILTINLKDVSN